MLSQDWPLVLDSTRGSKFPFPGIEQDMTYVPEDYSPPTTVTEQPVFATEVGILQVDKPSAAQETGVFVGVPDWAKFALVGVLALVVLRKR